jgi:hypothetical protein
MAVCCKPLSLMANLRLPYCKYTRTRVFALRFMYAIRQMEPPDSGDEDSQALDSLGESQHGELNGSRMGKLRAAMNMFANLNLLFYDYQIVQRDEDSICPHSFSYAKRFVQSSDMNSLPLHLVCAFDGNFCAAYPDQDSVDEAQGRYLSYPEKSLEISNGTATKEDQASSSAPSLHVSDGPNSDGKFSNSRSDRTEGDMADGNLDSYSEGSHDETPDRYGHRVDDVPRQGSDKPAKGNHHDTDNAAGTDLHPLEDTEKQLSTDLEPQSNQSSRKVVLDLLSNVKDKGECGTEGRPRKTIQLLKLELVEVGSDFPMSSSKAPKPLPRADSKSESAPPSFSGQPAAIRISMTTDSEVEPAEGSLPASDVPHASGERGSLSMATILPDSTRSLVSNKERDIVITENETAPIVNDSCTSSRQADAEAVWLAAAAADSSASAGAGGTFSLRSPLLLSPQHSVSSLVDLVAQSPVPRELNSSSFIHVRVQGLKNTPQDLERVGQLEASHASEKVLVELNSADAVSKFSLESENQLQYSPASPSLSPSPSSTPPSSQTQRSKQEPGLLPANSQEKQTKSLMVPTHLFPLPLSPSPPPENCQISQSGTGSALPVSVHAAETFPSWLPPPSPRAIIPTLEATAAAQTACEWLLQAESPRWATPAVNDPSTHDVTPAVTPLAPQRDSRRTQSESWLIRAATTAEGLVGLLIEVSQVQADAKELFEMSVTAARDATAATTAIQKRERAAMDEVLSSHQREYAASYQEAKKNSKLALDAQEIVILASGAAIDAKMLMDEMLVTRAAIDSELRRQGQILAELSHDAAVSARAISLATSPHEQANSNRSANAPQIGQHEKREESLGQPEEMPSSEIDRKLSAAGRRIRVLEDMVAQLSQDNAEQVDTCALSLPTLSNSEQLDIHLATPFSDFVLNIFNSLNWTLPRFCRP